MYRKYGHYTPTPGQQGDKGRNGAIGDKGEQGDNGTNGLKGQDTTGTVGMPLFPNYKTFYFNSNDLSSITLGRYDERTEYRIFLSTQHFTSAFVGLSPNQHFSEGSVHAPGMPFGTKRDVGLFKTLWTYITEDPENSYCKTYMPGVYEPFSINSPLTINESISSYTVHGNYLVGCYGMSPPRFSAVFNSIDGILDLQFYIETMFLEYDGDQTELVINFISTADEARLTYDFDNPKNYIVVFAYT